MWLLLSLLWYHGPNILILLFFKNAFWHHLLNSWLATTGKTRWTMGNISKTTEQSGTLKLHLERLWNALWHQWKGVTWNKRGLPCLERRLCFPIDSSCWWHQQVWDPVRGRQERVSMVHHVRGRLGEGGQHIVAKRQISWDVDRRWMSERKRERDGRENPPQCRYSHMVTQKSCIIQYHITVSIFVGHCVIIQASSGKKSCCWTYKCD